MTAASLADPRHAEEHLHGRVLALAPTQRDAVVTRALFDQAGVPCDVCTDTAALLRQIDLGAGALLLTEEALAAPGIAGVLACLREQPGWSDLPVVVLVRGGMHAPAIDRMLAALTNVTLLERPAPMRSVLSATQAALRARRRQYEIRDYLAEIERGQDALRASEHRQRTISEDLKRTESALREADRRKDEFLATLAHELRNPLGPIRLAARALVADGVDALSRRNSASIIERQIRAMALLLDDLLDVSRITRGRLELRREPVELAAIVTAAVETAKPLIAGKRHELVVELPVEPVGLDADPLRLSQVLANLLTNAAKYMDPGGRIEVVADCSGGEVHVAVRDSGIGLSAASMDRVFEMFSQVDSVIDRSEGGLGIGLALVKGIVQLHGGRVTVHSDGPGHGAEFGVHLPAIAPPPRRDGRTEHAEAADVHALPLTVLLADDNRDAATALAMLLRLAGHEVVAVYSGTEALEAGRRLCPQVVVLDIGMPGLNGYEAAAQMRTEEWARNATLIALTGWGQDADKQRARAAGFDHHLTKPVDPETLVALFPAAMPVAADQPATRTTCLPTLLPS